MTDKQIEQMAMRVAQLVLDGLSEIEFQEAIPQISQEEELLAELATLMTQLDFNLQKENYSQCEKIKNKIYVVENKLNKFK
jgi:lipoprotein NlpI